MATNVNLAQILPSETSIAGPFSLYNNSFIIEYFNPDPVRNASALMKGRYVANHPEVRQGKKYAQTPPLHLHFSQIETFVILRGRLGNTKGWNVEDRVYTAKDGIQSVERWTPHTFWPVLPTADPDTADLADEDAIMLVWSHPKLPGPNGQGIFPPDLDYLIFQSILGYFSDIHEGKAKLDLPLAMLQHYSTDSALVMLPTWWFLGPLRWWIPYKLQEALANLARWQGKNALIEKYIGKDNFERYGQIGRKNV